MKIIIKRGDCINLWNILVNLFHIVKMQFFQDFHESINYSLKYHLFLIYRTLIYLGMYFHLLKKITILLSLENDKNDLEKSIAPGIFSFFSFK